jgi:hypothetical protein
MGYSAVAVVDGISRGIGPHYEQNAVQWSTASIAYVLLFSTA